MPFNIIRQDITKMETDAIVSSGNSELRMEGGVSGAIFAAAGARKLEEYCRRFAPIKTAQAVISPAFRLKAKYIIHTTGPVYSSSDPEGSAELLRDTYKNVLQLAAEYKCGSIALPLISAGSFGFPPELAVKIAADSVKEFLSENEMDICLTLYGDQAFSAGERLMGSVSSYIDRNYINSRLSASRRNRASNPFGDFAPYCSWRNTRSDEAEYSADSVCASAAGGSLDDLIKGMDENFSESLMRLIDLKGKSDVEVYKRANIDRRLFSKIRSGNNYTPSKRTALALAIALELNLKETQALLRKAGYALSHSILFDVIVEYFIVNEEYDIFEINNVLFAKDQALLGS